jgi:phosphatidylglycerophosphate synthase
VAALVLDAVDGAVARRTGTASPFGARFDGEVDAAFILIMSAAAARQYGPWILAEGLMRYVFGAAGWALPWMRRRLPDRPWRKVATATAATALTVAVSGTLPRSVTRAGLAAGAILLAESFGRDVCWLWSRRRVT